MGDVNIQYVGRSGYADARRKVMANLDPAERPDTTQLRDEMVRGDLRPKQIALSGDITRALQAEEDKATDPYKPLIQNLINALDIDYQNYENAARDVFNNPIFAPLPGGAVNVTFNDRLAELQKRIDKFPVESGDIYGYAETLKTELTDKLATTTQAQIAALKDFYDNAANAADVAALKATMGDDAFNALKAQHLKQINDFEENQKKAINEWFNREVTAKLMAIENQASLLFLKNLRKLGEPGNLRFKDANCKLEAGTYEITDAEGTANGIAYKSYKALVGSLKITVSGDGSISMTLSDHFTDTQLSAAIELAVTWARDHQDPTKPKPIDTITLSGGIDFQIKAMEKAIELGYKVEPDFTGLSSKEIERFEQAKIKAESKAVDRQAALAGIGGAVYKANEIDAQLTPIPIPELRDIIRTQMLADIPPPDNSGKNLMDKLKKGDSPIAILPHALLAAGKALVNKISSAFGNVTIDPTVFDPDHFKESLAELLVDENPDVAARGVQPYVAKAATVNELQAVLKANGIKNVGAIDDAQFAKIQEQAVASARDVPPRALGAARGITLR